MVQYNKKESERKLLETFNHGLGKYTSLELLKQNLDTKSVTEIMTYSRKLEEGLIIQIRLSNTKLETKPSTNLRTNTPIATNSKKFCSFHKSFSHNTRDCKSKPRNYNVVSKGINEFDEKEVNRRNSLMINEAKENSFKSNEIAGKINNKTTNLILDTGSDLNYIHETAIGDNDLNLEESKPITLIFGGEMKECTNRKAVTNLLLNGKTYRVEFYVLKNLPVRFILGNEFLINNNCTINYASRSLIINKEHVIPLNGFSKTTEEELDERLAENACFSMTEESPRLNKLLKYYYSRNDVFSAINARPVIFKINGENKTIQSKGYSVPFKYLEQGREEIQRLLNEGIIRPSTSQYTSPAFFIKKKNNDLRLVVDYQRINTIIEDDSF
ncbi:MAG: aspartyl protease family protein, partial [Lactobacillaceae bacterium]